MTDRILKFTEYENNYEYSKRKYSFSPTELKNYPIQSFATGDVVPTMLGELFYKYKSNDNVKMVNTIHDSILFDVDAHYAVKLMEDVLEVLRNTHETLEEVFGIKVPVKFDASASFGYDWFTMTETKL